MQNETIPFENQIARISKLTEEVGRDMLPSEIAAWALMNQMSGHELDCVESMLTLMLDKKKELVRATLAKMSRIPQKNPRTFSNFETRNLGPEAMRNLKSFETLSFIEAKRNVIMIGPTGTGKTHIAQAIGNACCQRGLKTFFIKMEELKTRFATAINAKKTGSLLTSLSKYSCLIIDEAGYCQFSREETMMLFQLIDKYDAKTYGSIVLTSNKELSTWNTLFSDLDALECTLDRIWNNAICVKFSGQSYRGRTNDTMNFDFGGGLATIK